LTSHSDAKSPRIRAASEGLRLINPRPAPNLTPAAPAGRTGTTSAKGSPRKVTKTGCPVALTLFKVAMAFALKSETSMFCMSPTILSHFHLVKWTVHPVRKMKKAERKRVIFLQRRSLSVAAFALFMHRRS